MMEHLIKMDDFGVPPILGNHQMNGVPSLFGAGMQFGHILYASLDHKQKVNEG